MTAKKGLKIATVAGVPIYVSWSWWIFALLIMVVFRPTFAQALPGTSVAWSWAVSAFFVLIMFGTVLIHELAHALAALSFRWQVNEITLNFWGGATVYEHAATGKKPTPWRSLTVAIVGPISNLLIAGLAWLLLQVLLEPTGTMMVLLTMTVWTNLLIGIFNLLPGLPLDGGRVIESAVWAATGSRPRGLRAAGWTGRIIVLLLVAGAVLLPVMQTGEISMFAIVISAMIGFMLWQAASAAIRSAELQLRIEQMRITDLMMPVRTISSQANIAQLQPMIAEQQQGFEYQQFPTVICEPSGPAGHEVMVGLVDYEALAGVPVSSQHVPVSAVARKVNPAARIATDEPVEDLITRFMEFPTDIFSVVDTSQPTHRIVGIINPETLAARLHA